MEEALMRRKGFVHALRSAGLGVALVSGAAAQTTELVSVDSSGNQANGTSYSPILSADGTGCLFTSDATNLCTGDTNGVYDVFWRDFELGTTERVSTDSNGNEANGYCWGFAVDADADCIAFWSAATNLCSGDTNHFVDIFTKTRSTGVTKRVSVDSNGNESDGDSYYPSMSSWNMKIAYETAATNLFKGDTNGYSDIVVYDDSDGTTVCASVDSNGNQANAESTQPKISGNGQFAVFVSRGSNLVKNDTNGTYDVFCRDLVNNITELVSVDSNGVQGNGMSLLPSVSFDGRFVAFASDADNLVSGDKNKSRDVFLRDRQLGKTICYSVNSNGVPGNGYSSQPSIWGLGSVGSIDDVAMTWWSYATDLCSGDDNYNADVFFRQHPKEGTFAMNLNLSNNFPKAFSLDSSISKDGQSVVFQSGANDLVASDTNGFSDVFRRFRCDAAWDNHGDGFPGTNGIPDLVSQGDPVLGNTISVDLENSRGVDTPALFFLGFDPACIQSSWGGELHLVPAFTLFFVLPAGGITLSDVVQDDPALWGLIVYMQAIMADPGAAKGVSFTPGLRLQFGH
jgi:hypothetical protein